MLRLLKNIIKFFLPKFVLNTYHGTVSYLANFVFEHPSDRLIVIGVTGTNGKTTTVNLIARILEEAGFGVGYLSTAMLKISSVSELNPRKMTMPSGWVIHKSLAKMVKSGAKYAVLEVSSEGLAQRRHKGINFDLAVFTNLTPEHLDSHGSFENYRDAKAILFKIIGNMPMTTEKLAINPELQKTIIVNIDDKHGQYFANYKADRCMSFSINDPSATFNATKISYNPKGVSFTALGEQFNLQLKGQFDVYNALAAITVARSQNIAVAICKRALEAVEVVPGRMELIHGNFFNVIVDYAYEPVEMKQLYETISRWPYRMVIQVLGPTGGGRDKARIPLLGQMAGHFGHYLIITTDDPYDSNPKKLAGQMLEGAIRGGKILDEDVFVILDRRKAIAKAISLAQPNDLVLVTGKGSDQTMALSGGNYVPWDDRRVVEEELANL